MAGTRGLSIEALDRLFRALSLTSIRKGRRRPAKEEE
jgi:hypothetical protein